MAYSVWNQERIVLPRGSTLPRDPKWKSFRRWRWVQQKLPDVQRKRIEALRLFSIHTRHYLRRRSWRYFRQLGKAHPERYLPAVLRALKLYKDGDVADGVALLDNWGLIHILFHYSPALTARSNGWCWRRAIHWRSYSPRRCMKSSWRQAPQVLLELLREAARCRPVRQWAIRFLRGTARDYLARLPVEELLGLLTHEEAEVVALAAEALRHAPGIEQVSVACWLELLRTPNPDALATLCELTATYVLPEQVTLIQAARLARSRPVPLARLGLRWLGGKTPANEGECWILLGLVEAQSGAVRGELIRWARGVLGASAHFQEAWLLEYLDSRHADVRAEGWAWLREEPRARNSVDLWRKLLESPYDDVRVPLVAELENHVSRPTTSLMADATLSLGLVRFLWAAVLLNIHRGGRVKPLVVGQIVRRLTQRPGDASVLLPILSVALRSVRGPEWRAGLAGVVQLVERQPELAGVVEESFPELRIK